MSEENLRDLVNACNRAALRVAGQQRPSPFRLVSHLGHACVLMTYTRNVFTEKDLRLALHDKKNFHDLCALKRRVKNAQKYVEKTYGVDTSSSGAVNIFRLYSVRATDLRTGISSHIQRKAFQYIPQKSNVGYAYFFVPAVLVGAMIAMDDGDETMVRRLIASNTLKSWDTFYDALLATLAQVVGDAIDAQRQFNVMIRNAAVDAAAAATASPTAPPVSPADGEIMESSSSESIVDAIPMFDPLNAWRRSMLSDDGDIFLRRPVPQTDAIEDRHDQYFQWQLDNPYHTMFEDTDIADPNLVYSYLY